MTARLYARAIAHYGRDEQLAMVAEECAELTVAVSHYQRGRATREAVAEEIADTIIMCEQAAQIIGPELVAKAKAAKLERLAGRLEVAAMRERYGAAGNHAAGCSIHDGPVCSCGLAAARERAEGSTRESGR